jgi:hypothetical protein
MRTRLRILSIGLPDPIHAAYNIFLEQHRCEFATVANDRDLYGFSKHESYDVAILHHTLNEDDLRETAHFIRRRWPKARILIIRAEAPYIDDALYDDRVLPRVNPELLLAAIDRLTDGYREQQTSM